jgi:hypothetical protein
MKKTFGTYSITMDQHSNIICLNKNNMLFQSIQATAQTSGSVFKDYAIKLEKHVNKIKS